MVAQFVFLITCQNILSAPPSEQDATIALEVNWSRDPVRHVQCGKSLNASEKQMLLKNHLMVALKPLRHFNCSI